MSFSTGKLFGGALPPLVPTKPSALTTRKSAPPLLQVRSEGKPESGPPKELAISRRDAMLSLPAATLAAVTFFSVEPAEARIVKPEIRRKIQEKFKMLREKAGLVDPKSDEEKQPALPSPPTPSPSPQISPIIPPVEAILP